MSKKLQSLLIAVGLFVYGSTAHALPVSGCTISGGEPPTQICDLYESDAFGNPSRVSSPVNSAFAPIYGADWAPRWIAVYDDAGRRLLSDLVHVSNTGYAQKGLFADTAILYSFGWDFIFKLRRALSTPLCNADNTDTTLCLLKIIRDANGIATFEQPFVLDSTDPDSLVEGFDTFIVERGNSRSFGRKFDFGHFWDNIRDHYDNWNGHNPRRHWGHGDHHEDNQQ